MPRTRTKGSLEADITAAVTQFERDHLGRGPREARTFILQDMVLVRLKGILTPAEQALAMDPGGVELIKQLRSRLVENSRDMLRQIVEERTGATMLAMHTDISTRTGERLFVFALDRNLEDELRPPA
jgi:uncharacterized protein YbcI